MRLLRKKLASRFNATPLPRDIESLIDIDTANESAPEDTDLTQAGVDNIWADTLKLFRTGMHPMLSICVRRRGKIVLNRSIGYQRGDAHSEDAVVASINTPVCLFSASKSISAMLVHLLEEQGKIHLMDPLSYYIPEFAENGKGYITIYQLLAHRAGVPGLGENVDSSLLFDREAAVAAICEADPIDHLGRTSAYHAITGGFLLDELIRRTTGKTVSQFLNTHIRKPLDMRYFRYGLTKRDMPSAAENRFTGLPLGNQIGETLKNVLGLDYMEVMELTNTDEFMGAVLPSGNMYATAEEASRFFQMMLDYGEYNGQRIMQPLTVHRAIQEAGKAEMDASLKLPMRYSPGFMLGGSPAGIYGKGSHYAYGHLGLSNVFCWADPERDISVAILNSGKPVLGSHMLALPRLLWGISRNCPPVRDMQDQSLDFLAV
ncbi:class A beta-lactamase-related serine hydrolase [Halioglobus maricola]|uniref:Class A beta-lactamase-related serine hydrolase n=1 Tax=Halioglobus maricola TaxID=2601894 RepID=A0A5P9NHH9_9GAMM|nr:serine hydrolase domain-containing protein [Halioglobus maricola]QFU75242.1 class A beta-lactamase-related serine hydrolase [Halioglobus maricola]